MAADDLTYTNHDSTALNLNDGSTYQLVEIRGIRGLPGEIVTSETPFVTPVGRYQGYNPDARTIEIELLVHGTLGTNLDTRIGALMAHFRVDQRDDELGVLTYTNWEGTQRAIEIAPPNGESNPIGSWLVPGRSGAGWAQLTLALIAQDPTFYDPNWVSDTDNFSGTGNVNLGLNNAGDEDAYLHIAVGATVTADWTITDANGTVLTFVDGVAGAETLTMYLHKQAKLFSMSHSVDGDWRGKRASASGFIVAPPGNHNLVFAGGDVGDNGAITAKCYPRYSTFR